MVNVTKLKAGLVRLASEYRCDAVCGKILYFDEATSIFAVRGTAPPEGTSSNFGTFLFHLDEITDKDRFTIPNEVTVQDYLATKDPIADKVNSLYSQIGRRYLEHVDPDTRDGTMRDLICELDGLVVNFLRTDEEV